MRLFLTVCPAASDSKLKFTKQKPLYAVWLLFMSFIKLIDYGTR